MPTSVLSNDNWPEKDYLPLKEAKLMHATRRIWALALSAILVGGCLAALAQEKMADVDGRLDKMGKELNLTADQKDKLKPILQNQSDSWRSVMDDKSLSKEQKQAKMKDIHEKYVPEINAVLTPAQQEKWKTMREQAWQEHKEHMDKH
jgi:Spy/CpxP family protein refolding chaperone